ncbi:MAG: hypothetical protein K9K67_01925 [Bacteriovoracaceae bacterium]|nr:hypothetical protein [Bacteriovoracaceae bacterium]
MSREDDFISKLMDETYEEIGHPICDLSNQNVVALSDYFNEREEGFVGSATNNSIRFETFKNFYRIRVAGKDLDIPEGLRILETIKVFDKQKLFKVEDQTFAKVLSELCGKDVAYVLVQTNISRASLLSQEPEEIEYKKSA